MVLNKVDYVAHQVFEVQTARLIATTADSNTLVLINV